MKTSKEWQSLHLLWRERKKPTRCNIQMFIINLCLNMFRAPLSPSLGEQKNQKDATIRCLLSTSVSTCFGHHYANLQKNKERNQQDAAIRCYYQLLSQHVSGIIMPIFRRTKKKATRCNNQMFIINFCLNMFRASLSPSSGEQRPCYCIWCTVLVLLDEFGRGCGALRCRMRDVLASYNAAPHNRYQPHPAEPAQYTKVSNTVFVLLKMGIMMPETCWDRSW